MLFNEKDFEVARVDPLDCAVTNFYKSGLHGFHCILHVVEFDTSVIFHVDIHCLGSLVLQDMLLRLHEFVFE